MIVSAPMNEIELRNLMYTAQLDKIEGPISIRYPRGNGAIIDWKQPFTEIEIGKGRKIKDGDAVAILTIGHPGNFALEACKVLENEGINAAHYDMRFVKPIDEEMLHEVFKNFDKIITVEDGCLMGGMGSAVLEFMADNKYAANVIRLGIPDKVVEHGTQQELYKECGYSTDDIITTARDMVAKKKKGNKALFITL
jgi:1-deoxy-D-xylulose-5-phosphate synthase